MLNEIIRYPMLMIPAVKDYLWGGNTLKTKFGKKTDLTIVAESWEISCHPDGLSIIGNGNYAGNTLISYVNQFGSAVVGPNWGRTGKFPLIVKLIDAADKLSVQVHPDDEYALKYCNDSGKNEMWYILDCEPGAEILLGFNKQVSHYELAKRIKNNTMLEIIGRVPVQKGDAFYIPAGMIHAIGKGILVAEVQQSSNATFRVYDFDRKDKNGHPRELHIKPALDVIQTKCNQNCRISQMVEQNDGYKSICLIANEYFSVTLLKIESEALMHANPESFQAYLCIEGQATIECNLQQVAFSVGQTVFIPAGSGQYKVAGSAKVLLIFI